VRWVIATRDSSVVRACQQPHLEMPLLKDISLDALALLNGTGTGRGLRLTDPGVCALLRLCGGVPRLLAAAHVHLFKAHSQRTVADAIQRLSADIDAHANRILSRLPTREVRKLFMLRRLLCPLDGLELCCGQQLHVHQLYQLWPQHSDVDPLRRAISDHLLDTAHNEGGLLYAGKFVSRPPSAPGACNIGLASYVRLRQGPLGMKSNFYVPAWLCVFLEHSASRAQR